MPPPGVEIGEWSRVHDLRIRVDHVALEKPTLAWYDVAGGLHEREGREPELVVRLTIQNVSATHRAEYVRWEWPESGLPWVRLTDQIGAVIPYRHRNGVTSPHIKGGLSGRGRPWSPTGRRSRT